MEPQSHCFIACLLENPLLRHRGTVSDATSSSRRSSDSLKTSNPSLSSAQEGSGKHPLHSPSSTTVGSKNDLARIVDSSVAINSRLHASTSFPDSPRSLEQGSKTPRTSRCCDPTFPPKRYSSFSTTQSPSSTPKDQVLKRSILS